MASAGFTSRRKTLVNALTPLWGRERAVWAVADAGLPPTARAETLGLDVFRRLSRSLGPPVRYNSSMSVTVGQAVLLGIVQGLTEFLPVSSTAHLALVQRFLPGFAQPGILFDVLLHVGTLAAVVVYFRARIAETLAGLFSRTTPRGAKRGSSRAPRPRGGLTGS